MSNALYPTRRERESRGVESSEVFLTFAGHFLNDGWGPKEEIGTIQKKQIINRYVKEKEKLVSGNYVS